MDQKIIEAVNFVHSYAPEIVDWITLKKELMKLLPSTIRATFSKGSFKENVIVNDLERQIMERWRSVAGRELYLSKYETKK